ncbi:MAG TPA: TonB-dependent receptor plug domain-containing protein, partial [Flavisolibacter sp.]
MKYRKQPFHSALLWLTGICLLLLQTETKAQNRSGVISGTVKTETGKLLTGVTVVASAGDEPQAASTMTDAKGVFRLANLATGKAYALTISSVGYETVVQNNVVAAVKPSGTTITLKESAAAMNNVVVTALGIKREQKALGYAAQQIQGQELTDARSNNWSGALSGKVAGLNLISPGSGPVNSTRISLRGDGSLNAESNQALIVVDGVPIQSGGTGSGVGNAYGAGSGNDIPVDFGNGIQDINPDDIESISILKGPGATALYGSRAGGGAILITTKSGSRKNNGIGITVNSNYSFNTVLKWPDYQYEYGQGT